MNVGVLALQGDVPEHRRALAELLREPQILLVRAPADLVTLDALLMPGGESTAISQLLESTGLRGPLEARLRSGLPVLATCAGLILVARVLERSRSGRDPTTFGLLDVDVRRNDYGAQVDSFEAGVTLSDHAGTPFPGVFIRAPKILRVGPGAEPFARVGDEVVGARSPRAWGLTFHPELSEDRRILGDFLKAAEALGRSDPEKK